MPQGCPEAMVAISLALLQAGRINLRAHPLVLHPVVAQVELEGGKDLHVGLRSCRS